MVKIEKGSIHIYRVFDVSEEIDLSLAEKILNDSRRERKIRVPKTIERALIVRSAPLHLSLPDETITTKHFSFTADVSARILDYGVISLLYKLPISQGTDWSTLVKMAAELEDNIEIDRVAQKQSQEVSSLITKAMKDPHSWDVFEDYTIYFLERCEGITRARDLIDKADIPALMLAEESTKLAEKTRYGIMENIYQYGEEDMAIVEWNSALVLEPEGKQEVLDLMEFALTHLMEMRYYDDLLDQRLAVLYDNIEKSRYGGLFSGNFSNLYKDASTRFIEFSEFIERVENSLKVVGDFYLATVYRATTKRFRLSDWQQNITRKMNILAQVSSLLQGEVNMRRSQWMEITIIALIAFEVVSAILKLY